MYEEHKEYTRNMILHMLSCCVVSYIYIYMHIQTKIFPQIYTRFYNRNLQSINTCPELQS